MPSSNTPTSICDLSDKLVCSVCEFLPKTSCALLAVALTAPSTSWKKYHQWKITPNTASKAIISSIKDNNSYKTVLEEIVKERLELKKRVDWKHKSLYLRGFGKDVFEREVGRQISEYYNVEDAWEILDFIDLPKDLASRLNDDDLAAIFICIDAKKRLKHLALTNCFNIVGHGLQPLIGSTILKTMNLGLARRIESLRSYDEAKLDRDVVIRFVRTGVLSIRGNSFTWLRVPRIWYDGTSSNELAEMLYRYPNTVLNQWSNCWYFGFGGESEVVSLLNSNKMGELLIHGCASCDDKRGFVSCSRCAQIECRCCPLECIGGWGDCNDCGKRYCERCESKMDDYAKVSYCSRYDYGQDDTCPAICGSCRTRNSCNGTSNCNYCKAKVFDKMLVEKNDKQSTIDQLRRQIEELHVSNE